MREESKIKPFDLPPAKWSEILGEGFGEHARRIFLILCIGSIWIGFSPHPDTSKDQTTRDAEQSAVFDASVGEAATVLPLLLHAGTASLADRALLLPVKGIGLDELQDSFDEKRGSGRRHQAIDIIAEARTPVVAVKDGTVAKIESSRLGGLSVYQFDPARRHVYYYAHLAGYAPGLQEGGLLRQGDLIGYVGQTGNAEIPHLHFAISRLGPDQKWWRGKPLNPYPLLRQARPS